MGLDIGHETLKVAQIKGSLKHGRLQSINEVAIPPCSLTKDGIKDKKLIAEAIALAIKNAKPRPINARICSSALPESLVFTKIIELPKMKPEEIKKNIPFQATEFFPIPIEETYMDWQIINEFKDRNMLEIFVVAAPKVLVDSLSETVKMAGLELLGLETKPIAVSRVLINIKEQGPYLILDIGAKTTGITCFDQGNIKLTSTVTIGGEEIRADAEKNLQALAAEITHLIKYYQNRIGQAQVFKRIILAGGGANHELTQKLIQDYTKIKTELGLPAIPMKNYDPKFAAVLGLALKDI